MGLPDWARAHASVPLDGSAPLFAATFRTTPADFDVTEELGIEFSGDGEHDFLSIEKTSANTEWVARQLAQHAGVPAKDVGYSGLKDRHAITRQWFSVPRWNGPDWSCVAIEGVSLLDVQRHSRKLRRGTHKANHFRIVLRGESPDRDFLDERVQRIRDAGVPNYYGEQRFGRDGSNIELANSWSAGKRLPRHKRSIAISTLRSFLFNETLDRRVRDDTWNRILPGDIVNLDGTSSIFNVEDVDPEIERRCAEMDIHPAEVLAGEGSQCGHEAWQAALDNARVKAASRSLRLRVHGLQMEMSSDCVRLSFRLGRGAYATSVLREIACTTHKFT